MHERGKSDRLVVPTKPPNKAMAAEVVEGRGRGEGNPSGTTRPGHRAGSGVPHVPDRVRRTGAGESGALITSLLGVGPCDARPEPGAQCGSSARWDLRGGPPARAVPTATAAPAGWGPTSVSVPTDMESARVEMQLELKLVTTRDPMTFDRWYQGLDASRRRDAVTGECCQFHAS